MHKQIVLCVLGYVFMIGFFLLLTVVFPSTVLLEPDWIEMGSFAQYSVEDWGGYMVMNGTYTWKIIAVKDSGGRKIVTINETFKGTTHWDHVVDWDKINLRFKVTGEWHIYEEDNIIPPSGRIRDVVSREGAVEGLVLWFKRYYNYILLYRSFFFGGGYVYRGIDEGKTSFEGEVRDFVQVSPGNNRRAYYDKATGLLLRYSWTWPRLGTVHVFLKSTNVFDSTKMTGEPNGLKMVLDVLLVAPLFALPLAGGIIGLFLIRRKGVGFGQHFWLEFILLNGIALALLSDWPVRIFWILNILLNMVFWIGILGVAVLIINRFMFPIVKQTD